MLSFLFCEQRKASGYEIVFEELNDVFFTGKRKIACLKCNQGSEVFEDFFFSLYGQENDVFKREFTYV